MRWHFLLAFQAGKRNLASQAYGAAGDIYRNIAPPKDENILTEVAVFLLVVLSEANIPEKMGVDQYAI
jgi:hypothetical protein